jgi:hypothetical protein
MKAFCIATFPIERKPVEAHTLIEHAFGRL